MLKRIYIKGFWLWFTGSVVTCSAPIGMLNLVLADAVDHLGQRCTKLWISFASLPASFSSGDASLLHLSETRE